ncbi:hypothetical protein [Actinocrinis sp.]|uniref:hypothetical protein n=1 Tax=Actinocrinis sp. TaxID=1920516 RepID=UPI002DDD8594|nr:hypothetical protein [Actinocrinis sp.]
MHAVRVAGRCLRRLAHCPEFWRPIRWCASLGLKILIATALLLAMHMSSQTFNY